MKKNYFFCSYFCHNSLCFYSNSEQESSLDAEFNSTSNEYPHCILLMNSATPKTRNTWKKSDDGHCYPKNKKYLKKCDDHHHVFLGISCFWGSRVRQKYVVWVLVGCGIKSSHFLGISCFGGRRVHQKYVVWVLVGCRI